MDIKRLQQDRRRVVQVPVTGDDGEVEMVDLAVWHKPITPAVLAEMTAASEGDAADKERLVSQLAAVLTRWDITDNGKPIKPTAAVLRGFEFEVLAAIAEALFASIYPKSTT